MDEKIIIVGGSGFIGKRLTVILREKKFIIYNLTRNPNKNNAKKSNADFDVKFPNENKQTLLDIFSNATAVINLAGAPIAGRRWSKKYKEEIYNSRINTTKKISELINECSSPPKVLINASAVGYYGDRDDEFLDESKEPGNDFLSKVCIDWEQTALLSAEKTRVVLARIGLVLDKKEGALPKLVLPFNFYLGGTIGSGKQWLSWIHIDDILRLFLWSIENENVAGPINFVSPHPVTMKHFVKELSHILKKPAFFPIPTIFLKIIMGESACVLTNSQRAIPEYALNNGYNFTFTELNKALKDLLAEK